MPTYKSYITGFLLSIVLTITAYFVVVNKNPNALLIILVLAIVQLFVQLIFFLHLNKGSDRRWNLAAFLSTIFIVLLVVVGSLWIMNHLNYNMTMSPEEIIQDEGIEIMSNHNSPTQIKNLPDYVLPEQINATSSVNGLLYALAAEPNMNFYLPGLEGKTIQWHGVLRSQDKGLSWKKFFTITDPVDLDNTGGLSYNPVGVFMEGKKIYVDIINTRGAGSGEGELIRFSSDNDGKTWERLPDCYYVDMSAFYERNPDHSLDLSTVNNPKGFKAKDCVY